MNERDPDAPRPSCRNAGAKKLREELKDLVKDAGLKGRVRVLETSCMDQCEHAAVCVVYPDNVWYSMVKAHDAKEIVHEHLLRGRVVDRLLHDNPANLRAAEERKG